MKKLLGVTPYHKQPTSCFYHMNIQCVFLLCVVGLARIVDAQDYSHICETPSNYVGNAELNLYGQIKTCDAWIDSFDGQVFAGLDFSQTFSCSSANDKQKGFINFCANRRIPDAEGQQSPGQRSGRIASRISDEKRGICQHGTRHHEGPVKALHVTGCERLVLDVATVDAPAKVTARIRLVGHCQG